jgi:Mrp family chromosome partitioning ATPase
MNALDLLIALRRRWRVIAVAIAATVSIAWITTPATSKATSGSYTWTGSQTIYITGGRRGTVTLERVATYLVNGPVPRSVGAAMRMNVVEASTANAKGAQRHATIGTVTVDAKPIASLQAIAISTTGKKSSITREVADQETLALERYMDEQVDQDYKTNIQTLTTNYNTLGKQLDAAGKAWAACSAKDRTCRIETRTTYDQIHSAWASAGTALRNAKIAGKQPVQLTPIEVDAANQPQATLARSHHAGTATIPVAVKPRLALGFVVGLLLGALLAFVFGKLDSSLYGVKSAEGAARLPVLAEIPHISTSRRRRFEVLTQLSPLSGVADAYRGLRTSISLMWLANESETGRTEPRMLVITSPGPNEGKSTTSANLAAAYAEMGKAVIVVDLDFRRQRLHKFLGAHAEPHLANVGTLSAPAVDLEAITQSTSIPGVRFIASAPPDATPAEAAVAGRAAILAAAEHADIVIIDTPPLLLTNDTFDLLDIADAVLLLARDARTKGTALTRASQQLRRLDAPVLGIALIGAVSSRPGYGYGYGYGYRYGYSYGGYGYGYGTRTGLDQHDRVPADEVVDLTMATLERPPATDLLDPPFERPRRRFGVRRAVDAGGTSTATEPDTDDTTS